MYLVAPQLARVGLTFSQPEYFALAFAALTLIASLGGGGMLKAFTAGFFGLLLATIGIDEVTSDYRFTFGGKALVGGINFRYDMSAKRQFDVESNEYVKFKPADFYLEFGFGIDTYLRYFKFAPELKLAIGLRNIITDDYREPYPQFVSSIDKATSYIVMLNFHFE